jgi:hypothetical protein
MNKGVLKKTLANLMLVLLQLILLPIPSYGAEKTNAKTALTCTEDCPYFSDIYAGDAEFRKSFLTALKWATICKPEWVPDGVQTPMEPIAIGEATYLASTICEPHNCQHHIGFLYLESQKRTVGKYDAESGNSIWFGKPNGLERKEITNLRINDHFYSVWPVSEAYSPIGLSFALSLRSASVFLNGLTHCFGWL